MLINYSFTGTFISFQLCTVLANVIAVACFVRFISCCTTTSLQAKFMNLNFNGHACQFELGQT